MISFLFIQMKCPHPIEPHQIQGLDFIHMYPVVQVILIYIINININFTFICSGWWRKLWRLGGREKQPIVLILWGDYNFYYLRWSQNFRSSENWLSTVALFVENAKPLLHLLQSTPSGNFRKNTDHLCLRTSNWKTFWWSLRWLFLIGGLVSLPRSWQYNTQI